MQSLCTQGTGPSLEHFQNDLRGKLVLLCNLSKPPRRAGNFLRRVHGLDQATHAIPTLAILIARGSTLLQPRASAFGTLRVKRKQVPRLPQGHSSLPMISAMSSVNTRNPGKLVGSTL